MHVLTTTRAGTKRVDGTKRVAAAEREARAQLHQAGRGGAEAPVGHHRRLHTGILYTGIFLYIYTSYISIASLGTYLCIACVDTYYVE